MQIKPLKIAFGLVLLYAVVFALLLQDESLKIFTYGMNMLSISAAVVTMGLLVKAYGISSKIGRATLFIWGFLLLWWVGEAIWTYYGVRGIFPGYTIADLFYLSGVPVVIWGVVAYIKLIQAPLLGQLSLKKLTIEGLIGFGLLGIIWYFSVYQSLDMSRPLLENLILVGYGLNDSVLLIVAVIVWKMATSLGKGTMAAMWQFFVLGALLYFTADIFYAVYYDLYEQGLKPYVYMEILWGTSYLAYALSAWLGLNSLTNLRLKIGGGNG